MQALEAYRVQGAPEVIYYVPDFVTQEEHDQLWAHVYGVPPGRWKQLKNRRLQNWGGLPQPKGMVVEDLPEWLGSFGLRLQGLGLFEGGAPNHVLVNEYCPGQGIMPHEDGPLYWPTVATVSLGSHTLLDFYPHRSDCGTADANPSEPEFSLYVAPRSLVVLLQRAYTHYLHGIREMHTDTLPATLANSAQLPAGLQVGAQCERQTRVSLTIRHVPKVVSRRLQDTMLARLRR